MSDETEQATPTDQQTNAEQILRDMQRTNGGTLKRNAADRLVLVHDLKQP